MKHTGIFAFVTLALTACGTGGGDDPPTSATSDALVGAWTGYVEQFAFDDATDVVSISLDSVATDQVTGHVRFGERPLHAAPTDPEIGYPDGFQGESEYPMSGFAFTIHDGSFDGDRLRFSVASTEMWSAWCEMQTPVADDVNPGNYWCVPNWGYSSNETTCTQPNPTTLEETPVDCGKLSLCYQQMICQCTAEGCSVGTENDIFFDIDVDAQEADGSIAGLANAPRNIHLSQP